MLPKPLALWQRAEGKSFELFTNYPFTGVNLKVLLIIQQQTYNNKGACYQLVNRLIFLCSAVSGFVTAAVMRRIHIVL